MTKLVYGFFYALSLLPFRALYVLADVEYFLVYYVVRYRRGVVRRNLTSAFPEKSEEEIKGIERRFYRWFADYFLEAIKLLSISDEELRRRFTITNSAVVAQCLADGQDVAAILGHYCNWEWLSTVSIDLPDNVTTGLIYDPLHSKAIDYLFRKLRSSQPAAQPVPKKDVLRALQTLKQQGRRSFFGYISDQAPKWENIHLWLPFLNHETPVFTGAERIMKKKRNAVFYVEMSRPQRGYYTCTYHLITREPEKLADHEITRTFFQMLEKTIRRQPEYYLWTHNHWKRTKEEFDRRFKVVNGKVIKRTTLLLLSTLLLNLPMPAEAQRLLPEEPTDSLNIDSLGLDSMNIDSLYRHHPVYHQTWRPSPNYDTLLVNRVEGVVLHHTATRSAKQAIALLTDTAREASCHVIIDYDGTRYILCDPEQVAWHAGKSVMNGRDSCNRFTVGIELQGNTLQAPLTLDQIFSAIEYLEPIIRKYGIRYENIVTHEMVRTAWIEKYGMREGVFDKVDITQKEYHRFLAILRAVLPEERREEEEQFWIKPYIFSP